MLLFISDNSSLYSRSDMLFIIMRLLAEELLWHLALAAARFQYEGQALREGEEDI